ncbi:HAG1 [Symbiodinium natans]|uniref:HAG1 protein n=1 Tax=Symbiodinium natans TaxID=878477 RepID=A0A812RHV5_9DINO|nr:HAG1 [Symbiodinium natans]
MTLAGADGLMWQCTLGDPKVRIRGPQDLKGVCVEAVSDAQVDETLLTEMPLLATPPSSPAQRKRVDAFCKTLPQDTREDRLAVLLTRRWLPVLCAFADAPKGIQEAVLSLQSDFESPECGMSQVTDRVATALSLAGVCSGTMPKSISRSKLSRERMHELLNVMVINAADTLPDGGEAVFCIGALFEHSCEPNAQFCLSSGNAALAARLGLKTSAKQIWIGEWRATRPVRAGEAVTVSYLETEMLKLVCISQGIPAARSAPMRAAGPPRKMDNVRMELKIPPRRADRRKSLQDELMQASETEEEAAESLEHANTEAKEEDDDSGEDEIWYGNDEGPLPGGFGEDDESEESSFMDDDEIEGAEMRGDRENQDAILDWWCQRQLLRVLRRLVRLPKAGPFKEPLPWQELGLDDYPEVITDPIDLRTIAERLETGGYQDEEGFVNPDFFWQDVAACWENCKIYYEEDPEIEAVRMAEEMRVESEKMEEEFWRDLEKFEASLDRVKGAALSKVAAVADVAKGAVEDAASLAVQESKKLAKRAQDWWNKLRGKKGEELQEQRDIQVLELAKNEKPRLRDHFLEMLKLRFRMDGWEDIMGIEEEVIVGMRQHWPLLEEESDLLDYPSPQPASRYNRDHIAVERLLPTKYVACIPGGAPSRPKRGESLASSRSSMRSSRVTGTLPGSRRNSLESSRAGSRGGSRAQSPARSETSASRHTPRSHRSDGSLSAFSHGSESSKLMSRAVRASVLEAGMTEVPGVDTSSESDQAASGVPSVQRLSTMMPPRGQRPSVVSEAA